MAAVHAAPRSALLDTVTRIRFRASCIDLRPRCERLYEKARNARSDPWHLCCSPDTNMSTAPQPPEPAPTGPVIHQFTVLRGMAVALVIETCDWYSGLLQAAMARVRLEGQN